MWKCSDPTYSALMNKGVLLSLPCSLLWEYGNEPFYVTSTSVQAQGTQSAELSLCLWEYWDCVLGFEFPVSGPLSHRSVSTVINLCCVRG